MSDTPQGPGWWQSSDGNWYPPELHPDPNYVKQYLPEVTSPADAPAGTTPLADAPDFGSYGSASPGYDAPPVFGDQYSQGNYGGSGFAGSGFAGEYPLGEYPGQPGLGQPGYTPYGGTPVEWYTANGQPVIFSGWWRRVGATLIDAMVVFFPLFLIFTIVMPHSTTKTPVTTTTPDFGLPIVFYLIILIVMALYQILLLGSNRGQTVGMMAVGTRVVKAVDGQSPIGYGSATLRYLAIAALGALYIVGTVLDDLWPLWDAKHQTLHDKVAGSLVIRIG
ncbi:MAG: RDD family protein [Actinobacteria bacterium]|nr:RDD family protein [Actinomycetota bacterium]